jgi:hypothetical protein
MLGFTVIQVTRPQPCASSNLVIITESQLLSGQQMRWP